MRPFYARHPFRPLIPISQYSFSFSLNLKAKSNGIVSLSIFFEIKIFNGPTSKIMVPKWGKKQVIFWRVMRINRNFWWVLRRNRNYIVPYMALTFLLAVCREIQPRCLIKFDGHVFG